MFSMEIGFVALIFLQVLVAENCKKSCTACQGIPICETGVNLVVGECGCCKTCAKQLYEACDAAHPCDHHKNLYCSFSDTQDAAGICVAKPGRSCFLDGKVYRNGESFVRGCKSQCTCLDSDIVCKPLCPLRPTILKNCDRPRLMKRPGRCCQEWFCDDSSRSRTVALHDKFSSKKIYRDFYLLTVAKRLSDSFLAASSQECPLQSTRWSTCSKTCGWGISVRVANSNKVCKMRKEIRLCQIRPCGEDPTPGIKKGKRYLRSSKASKPVRYSFSGCKSNIYYPTYCGQCTNGMCCSPELSKTIKVNFRCDDGRRFRKSIMFIESCSCRRQSRTREYRSPRATIV